MKVFLYSNFFWFFFFLVGVLSVEAAQTNALDDSVKLRDVIEVERQLQKERQEDFGMLEKANSLNEDEGKQDKKKPNSGASVVPHKSKKIKERPKHPKHLDKKQLNEEKKLKEPKLDEKKMDLKKIKKPGDEQERKRNKDPEKKAVKVKDKKVLPKEKSPAARKAAATQRKADRTSSSARQYVDHNHWLCPERGGACQVGSEYKCTGTLSRNYYEGRGDGWGSLKTCYGKIVPR